MTSPIRVHRGILQGGSLPSRLFNLIINTLTDTIKSEKIKCMEKNQMYTFTKIVSDLNTGSSLQMTLPSSHPLRAIINTYVTFFPNGLPGLI